MSTLVPIIFILALLAFTVYVLISAGRTFRKAGEKFWYIFIPIYNAVALARIGGKPLWWGLIAGLGTLGVYNKEYPQTLNAVLLFTGLMSLLFNILIGIAIAKKFKRSTLFGIFLLGLFSFIGYPIIGYGSATYDKNIPT